MKYILETYIGQPEEQNNGDESDDHFDQNQSDECDQQAQYNEFDLLGTMDTPEHLNSIEQRSALDDFINSGIPSPVWHAADQGHRDIVHLLKKYNCNYESQAPDGTTPKMLSELQNCKITKKKETPSADLVQMSLTYPLYKESEDSMVSFSNEFNLKYSEMEEMKLPELCPVKRFNWKNQNMKQILNIKSECEKSCKSRD